MKHRLHAHLPDIAAWLALGVATLVVCWPLGLTNRVLAGVDAFTYFMPYWAHRMEAFRTGSIPLWNPYLFSGVPFLANIQAAVLYPPHWPLSWLSPEQALVWSALLHAWLAAGFTYVLATKSLGTRRLPGFAAGLIFGLGGFTLARIENINQLNALAWLPATLWLYDETVRGPRRTLSFASLTVVIALQLLAGHTQTTFINLVGLGLWAFLSIGWPVRRRNLARLLPLLAVLPAAALSAAQLLPTIELNGLGLRTGGLDYRTAVSFSLRPQLLLRSFLPPFGGGLDAAFGSEGYAEFLGYVGITGLILAALGLIAALRAARARVVGAGPALRAVGLAAAGALLALGAYDPVYYVLWRFVPGFDLFRAPARWLELFSLGAALLASYGLDALPELRFTRSHFPRHWLARVLLIVGAVAMLGLLAWQQWPGWQTVVGWVAVTTVALLLVIAFRNRLAFVLLILLFAELVVASRAMPFMQATAPMATDLRNAPASLLAATTGQPPAGRDRFLSLSDIRYDPGDLAELRALQAGRLPAAAIDRLVRAAKQVEVLAPNLPLFFRLPAVDGYDGGLLPLHRYVMLQQLFLPPDQMTPDGRLAEQLTAIPDGRLLDLTGVRFVVTDKQRDLWSGDVYYDLEQSATIKPGAEMAFDLSGYPVFAADAIGVVAHLDTTAAATSQVDLTLTSPAGTANGSFFANSQPTAPPQPTVAALSKPVAPTQLTVRNTGESPLVLQGMSLINRQTRTHSSITVSPRGDFRRIHSGDVKIYERAGALGRAWLVHGIVPAKDEDDAQAAIGQPGFDPRSAAAVEAKVSAAAPLEAQPGEAVTTTSYSDERATYTVKATAPGLLVLADAWYPGWRATIDGKPAEILRANLLYRAIAVQPGEHDVVLEYAPQTWRTGLIISAATAFLVVLALLVARFIRLPAFLL